MKMVFLNAFLSTFVNLDAACLRMAKASPRPWAFQAQGNRKRKMKIARGARMRYSGRVQRRCRKLDVEDSSPVINFMMGSSLNWYNLISSWSANYMGVRFAWIHIKQTLRHLVKYTRNMLQSVL